MKMKRKICGKRWVIKKERKKYERVRERIKKLLWKSKKEAGEGGVRQRDYEEYSWGWFSGVGKDRAFFLKQKKIPSLRTSPRTGSPLKKLPYRRGKGSEELRGTEGSLSTRSWPWVNICSGIR